MDPKSLLLFFSLRQPRRIKVIENVLNGRKTVSNLYWGMRYGLLDDLNALKSVDKAQDLRSLKHLISHGNLITQDHRNYQLTPQGYQKAIKLKKAWYTPHFFKYNLIFNLKRFKDRFLLAIQVISEYCYHNRNYYPLQIDYWDAETVKQWFHFSKNNHLKSSCYRFLEKFLNRIDQLDKTLGWQAVNLLVGHDNPGQTLFQQGRQLHLPVDQMRFRQLDILGALVAVIKNGHSPFGSLLNGLETTPVSTNSLTTYHLARMHYDFNRIAKMQHIKLSTVKEHLLSTAIFYPSKFPFRSFINDKLIKSLSKIYHGNPDQWDFAKYSEVTGQSLDFFYFRLFQILRSNQNE